MMVSAWLIVSPDTIQPDSPTKGVLFLLKVHIYCRNYSHIFSHPNLKALLFPSAKLLLIISLPQILFCW